jgi:hypothetical protein
MSYDLPYMYHPIAIGTCNNCGEPIYQRIEPSGYAKWQHESDVECTRGAVLMRDSWGLKPSDIQNSLGK